MSAKLRQFCDWRTQVKSMSIYICVSNAINHLLQKQMRWIDASKKGQTSSIAIDLAEGSTYH